MNSGKTALSVGPVHRTWLLRSRVLIGCEWQKHYGCSLAHRLIIHTCHRLFPNWIITSSERKKFVCPLAQRDVWRDTGRMDPDGGIPVTWCQQVNTAGGGQHRDLGCVAVERRAEVICWLCPENTCRPYFCPDAFLATNAVDADMSRSPKPHRGMFEAIDTSRAIEAVLGLNECRL